MKVMQRIADKVKKNEQGAALLTVMTVLCVVTILMLATLSFVAQARYQTTKNYYNKQAFYTARSGLETMVSYVSSPENRDFTEALKSKIPAAGTGTLVSNSVDLGNQGEYTISIEYKSGGTIVITSEAQYGEATQSLSAYFVKAAGGIAGLFDSMIKTSGSTVLANNANVMGDITAWTQAGASNLVMDNSMKLIGALYNDGDVTTKTSGTEVNLTDGSFVIKGNYTNLNPIHFYSKNLNPLRDNSKDYIDVRGKITQTGGQMRIGYYTNDATSGMIDVYCNELEVSNSMTINGNLYVYAGNGYEGNVNISGSATLKVLGDVFIEGQLNIQSAKIDVDGAVYVAGRGVSAMSTGAFRLTGSEVSVIDNELVIYDKGMEAPFDRITFNNSIICAGNIVNTASEASLSIPVRASGSITNVIGSNVLSGQNASAPNYFPREFPDFALTGTLRENVPALRDRAQIFDYINQQLADHLIYTNAALINYAKTVDINTGTLYTDGKIDLIGSENFVIIEESFNIGTLSGSYKSNILIKLDVAATGDIFVYVPDGFGGNDVKKILIENNSPDYMVYFIIGDPDNISPAGGGSKPYNVTGSETGSFDNVRIMHKDTYVNMIEGKYLDFSDGANPDSDVYAPEQSTIYYVVKSDATLYFRNQSLIEGAVLAPNAKLEYTNGVSTGVVKPDGTKGTLNLFHIGSGVYGSVSMGNNPALGYVEPKQSPFIGTTTSNAWNESMTVIYKKH